MQKHPNKEIQEAIQYAENRGWTLKTSRGHCWGKIYCPHNDENCRCGEHCITSIWSTPKNCSNHAKQIKRLVNNCIHNGEY
jgi:hypothetical protein